MLKRSEILNTKVANDTVSTRGVALLHSRSILSFSDHQFNLHTYKSRQTSRLKKVVTLF